MKALEELGFKDVTSRGFPDLVCFRGDGDAQVLFVEIKPLKGKVKSFQSRVMRHLAKMGASCFRWSPEKGLEKILPSPSS